MQASLQASPTRPAAGPTILLVDDEPDILSSLRRYLEGTLAGVRVLTAASGPAGLDVVGRESVDLVLSDYRMPGMSGLEFLRQARARAPKAALLLMTAFPDLDLTLQALNQARLDHFFVKPLEPDAVRDTLHAILDARQSRDLWQSALRRFVAEIQEQRGAGASDAASSIDPASTPTNAASPASGGGDGAAAAAAACA